MTSGSAFDVPAGTVLGHEYAGEVVDVGPGGRLEHRRPRHCAADVDLRTVRSVSRRCTAPLLGPADDAGRLRRLHADRQPQGDEFCPIRCRSRMAHSSSRSRRGCVACGSSRRLGGARVVVIGVGAIGAAAIFWSRRMGAGTIAAFARTNRGETLAQDGRC